MFKKRIAAIVAAIISSITTGHIVLPDEIEAQPEEYKMLAYGDSAGQGASDNCRYENGTYVCDGYNVRLEKALETHSDTTVTLDNKSYGGDTMGEIATIMENDIASIQQADLITWDGGGNDWNFARARAKNGQCDNVCATTILNGFKASWDRALNVVEQNKKPEAVVKTQTYFYAYVAEDRGQNYFNRIAGLLLQMDAYAKQTAEAKGFHYVELIPMFNGNYYITTDPRSLGLTTRGDEKHPNTKGHTAIADAHIADGFGNL